MIDPNRLEAFFDQQGDALCERLAAAERHAATVRQQVDEYIEPLFRTYGFRDQRTGQPLAHSRDLYRTDADCEPFFAACDGLHRQHGHHLPAGHCPALIAENAVIRAEEDLVKAVCPVIGIDGCTVYGKHRRQLLDILRQMHAARVRRSRRLRALLRETVAARRADTTEVMAGVPDGWLSSSETE